MSGWRISAFSEQHATGKVADADGTERSFPIEAWVPCDPATAAGLAMSEADRGVLLPRVGEEVDVELRAERIVRVTRRQPIELAMAIFAEWFAKLCAIVPAMAGSCGRAITAATRPRRHAGSMGCISKLLRVASRSQPTTSQCMSMPRSRSD
jgi:hypothetical protein